MHRRPLYVTAAGCLLIFWGVVSAWKIFSIVYLASLVIAHGWWSETRSSDGLPFIMLVISGGIKLVAGINILRGANWARLLWAIWYVLDLLVSTSLSLDKNFSLTSFIIQFLVILFLFLPGANEYFTQERGKK